MLAIKIFSKLTSGFAVLAILAAATLAAPGNTSTSEPDAPSSSSVPAPSTSAIPSTTPASSTPAAPSTTSAPATPTEPSTTSAPATPTAPSTTAATPSPPATPSAPAGGAGTCSTGALQCCESVLSANSTAISPILGILGVVLQDLDLPIGLSCSGVTGVGVGSSDACSTNAVCCQNNDFGGVIAIGCLPVSL
ncbi:hydrophobin-domain-containing protein [Trametes versicolor FP-101664 SS1]|uniref:hydrophobin-domain-containing protein n=1 Tax=Trametes versicolor (strain FP-101664) TaxID=717944 RepID=UPI0004622E61|nr:hydrophobin-domain-containing protein [Trametes versicolor FP-101664 SS1]EIW52224.1 hydrophobin-domain-containing protein [Trametes versicolor FP-101664 SS1]